MNIIYFLSGAMVMGGVALIVIGVLLDIYCDEYDKIWKDLFS